MDELMDDFVVPFGIPSRSRKTLLRWTDNAFAMESVGTLSGRPSTCVKTCAAVDESIPRSPMKSMCKRSAELHSKINNDVSYHYGPKHECFFKN